MHFEISEVLTPGVTGGAVDYERRRPRVLMDMGGRDRVIVDRLLTFLPRVLHKWGRNPFPISRVEAQTTASNHGDFFSTAAVSYRTPVARSLGDTPRHRSSFTM
jgi:hypothetical protein